MAEKMARSGYLGIEKEKNAAGAAVVKSVVPGSPAEAAGFRAGDVLVAMQGVRFAAENNQEAFAKVKAGLGVGKPVTYTVVRAGREQQLTATLGPVPREVLAQWVGSHVLEHAAPVVAAGG